MKTTDLRIAHRATLLLFAASVVACTAVTSACSRDVQAMSPQQIEQQYGVSGAYSDTLVTPDGSLKGTVVPVTLADGRHAQLVIPTQRRDEPHAIYLSDADGIHPVQIADRATRDQVVQSPGVVGRRAEPAHPKKRSFEKEALIVGGGAGAGALIGGLAKGGKGAAVGAATGGIGGLIYDLATRNK
jgi:hypothetical protein